MKKIIIGKNEEGYKLRKLCMNYLNQAPASFIYKMLRKKNIVLNDRKASGEEVLKAGDSVKLYLSDETIAKFSKNASDNNPGNATSIKTDISKKLNLDIIYEDNDYIFCNKPVGFLSQKASNDDYSINEAIIDYLTEKGEVTEESLKTFKPSICNRLDRNTGGIILAGKSSHGSRYLSQIIKDRSLKKYYLTIVSGKCGLSGVYKAYLKKDSRLNKVEIRNASFSEADEIITGINCLDYDNKHDLSLLEIELITGKSHQIRAHLAHLGYPIIGDIKYNSYGSSGQSSNKYQLLNAYKVIFPKSDEAISNRVFYSKIPQEFYDYFALDNLIDAF